MTGFARRPTLTVLTALLAIGCAANVAHAQQYPSKYIRLIVPYVPGGGTDTLSRLLAPKVSELLGQQVVIENRAGGNTIVGLQATQKAATDGYIIVIVDTSFTTNPSLYKLPFDPITDFAPISLLATAPVTLVVHPSVPARTVKEYVGLAKAHPGQLNLASGAPGSSTHLGAELLKYAAKVDIVNIPYKGTGQAISDVLGGQVGCLFAGVSTVRQHVETGRLHAIAVTGDRRVAAMPKVPTFIESGLKGVDSGTYWGILGPVGLPRDIVTKLSQTFRAAVESPDIKAKLEDRGYTALGGSPEAFGENIKTEIAKWARVVKAANIKVEQ